MRVRDWIAADPRRASLLGIFISGAAVGISVAALIMALLMMHR